MVHLRLLPIEYAIGEVGDMQTVYAPPRRTLGRVVCNKWRTYTSSNRRIRRNNQSMKAKTGIVLGVLLVALCSIGALVVLPWLQDRTVVTVVQETISRGELGIEFSFPSGEGAYSYIEPVLGTSTEGGPIGAFVMIKSDAYTDYLNAPASGEAPPAMSIFVFAESETATVNTGTTSPDRLTKIRTWAEANSGRTLYNLAMSTPEEVRIDGAKALHYKADGLYPNDVYVTFYKNKYYLIVGQYDGESDPQYTAFKDLVNSILFI